LTIKLTLSLVKTGFFGMGGVVVMNGERRPAELRFKVECTWCGVVIRRDDAKDSRGMCLKCYARMLGEHGHSHEQGIMPRGASDR
jgi:hypothetical protein